MEPELYASYRKSRHIEYINNLMEKKMTISPGMEWDAVKRRWAPADYLSMSSAEMERRRTLFVGEEKAKELRLQVDSMLPSSAAQALLNKSAEQLLETIIKVAKKAPLALLEAI